MRYYGSGTVAAVQAYADALAELATDGVNYSIFVAHAGVEGQLAFLDVVSRHKITIHVVEDLVGIDVAVVVRSWNGFWMVVVQAWHK